MRHALSICIIVTMLSSCATSSANKEDLYRSDLEFLVDNDRDNPGQKCIMGNYPSDRGLSTKYTEKVEAEFESDLPIGTPVRPVKFKCEGCVTKVWSGTSYADGKNYWSLKKFKYKIIARPLSDKEA